MAAGEFSPNIHDYGTPIEGIKKIKCNYCGKLIGSFFRVKCHLAGVGTDVRHCKIVPLIVRILFREQLKDSKNKKIKRDLEETSEQNLPSKRNRSPHLSEAGPSQTGSSGSRDQAESDSEVAEEEDSVIIHGWEDEDSNGEAIEDNSNGESIEEGGSNGESIEDDSKKCIARFFYETGIDFTAATSPSFKRMLNAGNFGNGSMKLPTPEELKGRILCNEVREMQQYVNQIRESWAKTGCSILLDDWVNEKGQNLVNFVVECPEGRIYLRSADVSAIVSDVGALILLLDRVIEEVGKENVVQIVASSTTGWVGNVGEQYMVRRQGAFWNFSVSCCIKLMLEKIVMIGGSEGMLDKLRIITMCIYRHGEVLKLMKNYTCGSEFLEPSKLKFAVPFLTLEKMVAEKKNLKRMFASSAWLNMDLASTPEGKQMVNIINDVSFWNKAEMTAKATVPLLRVLELVTEDDKIQVSYIYETMDQAKEAIKQEFNRKKSLFLPFWDVIDDVWNPILHTSLHGAAYYLNPCLFFTKDFFFDAEVAYGVLCSLVRLVKDLEKQDLITLQLDEYRYGRGTFGDGSSEDKITNITPVEWWCTYGEPYPELQKFAISILSQTCEGAARYGLKRSLAEKLFINGRNSSSEQHLNDLVFVHYNLHLKNIGEVVEVENDLVTEKTTGPMEDSVMAEAAPEASSGNDGSEAAPEASSGNDGSEEAPEAGSGNDGSETEQN